MMGLISDTVHGLESLAHLRPTIDGTCEGAKYHSPIPLQVNNVWLSQVIPEVSGERPPVVADDEDPIWLCANCYGNLKVFCSLLVYTQGSLSWEVRREFANRVRDLGMRAWQYHVERESRSA
jgi:hypothetical protein